jgi:hypothetical protein
MTFVYHRKVLSRRLAAPLYAELDLPYLPIYRMSFVASHYSQARVRVMEFKDVEKKNYNL